MTDILVLGGGVAGAATALMLRRHAPELAVLVVERSRYERVRIGETLPPQAQALLRQLGVWKAFLAQGHRPSHGTSAAWGSADPHHNDFIFTQHGHGWHLDRRAFDEWLAKSAQRAGASLWVNARFQSARRDEEGWIVEIERDDSAETVSARFIVDATGRLALLTRQLGIERIVVDQLVGKSRFYDACGGQHNTLVEAISCGWFYSAGLPNDSLIVALMSDTDLQQNGNAWSRSLAEAPLTQARVESAESTSSFHTLAAHTQRLAQPVGDHWLAVGDAACTYDPLSSQGMFKGIHSGIFAAYAISDHQSGDVNALPKYARLIEQSFAHYLETRTDYYARERRFSAEPFWQRRQL